MSAQAITVKQIANRLENATSLERIDALQELQSIAKQSPEIVGEFSLKKVLDFLKEQGSSEEYQEALDLIYRLVKCRDKEAAKKNSAIILGDGDARSVQLLLELLEHEDLMVGVMTSQILTEIHANDGATLEAQIQMCPDGMNKLLQRLPDASREEVRNQAIVLIQQLTANNEEMKKTVVFNEGFEILFSIIRSEGGANDAGLVTQDCLVIVNNILNNSETCQRLFFGMGGIDWILRLADFFDPLVLESKFSTGGSNRLDGESGEATSWYDQPSRLSCAILALSALYNSLSVLDKNNQAKIAKNTSIVIPSAAFWIARRGPAQLCSAALSLLFRAVDGNSDIADKFAEELVKISPAQVGRNVPFGTEAAPLQFSWRPSQDDDRRLVSLTALLVERYIFTCDAWQVEDGLQLGAKLHFECAVSGEADSFSASCLRVFEKILSVGPATSDLLVQYILAPPPPPGIDMMSGKVHESMAPLGTLVLNLLLDGCSKVLGSSGQQFGGLAVSSAVYKEAVAAERATNVLALIFVSGSSLAKEFATAIRDEHTNLRNAAAQHSKALPLLPILLSTASRMARIPGGGGYTLLVAILRLLASVASGCELAVKQMLEDPANLFVVELASSTSEAAGVPTLVQVAACFFLGCCFEAYADPSADGKAAVAAHSDALSKSSFLSMIDKRIGLNRFTEILKKPLLASRGGGPASAEFAPLFFSAGFRAFYESQVESIRKGIFSFYSGATSAAAGQVDEAVQKMLDMHKSRIAELEERLKQQHAAHSHATGGASVAVEDSELIARHEAEVEELRSSLAHAVQEKDKAEAQLSSVAAELQTQNTANDGLAAQNATLQTSLEDSKIALQDALNKAETLLEETAEAKRRSVTAAEQNNALQREFDEFRAQATASAARASEQTDALAKENSELRAQLSSHATSASEQGAGLQAKDSQIAALTDKNAKSQQSIEALTAELATARKEAAVLNEKLSAESARVAELLSTVDKDRAEIESLRGRVSNADAVAQVIADNHAASLPLIQEVLKLVSTLDIHVPGMDKIGPDLQRPESSPQFKSDWLVYLLNHTGYAVTTAMSECSAVAASAGALQFTTPDASVGRAVECTKLLKASLDSRASELQTAREDLQSSEERFAEMKARLTNQENTSQAETAEKFDELARQNHVLVNHEKHLQEEVAKRDGLLAQLQESSGRARAEIADLQANLQLASKSAADLRAQLNNANSAANAENQTLASQLKEAREHSAALEARLHSQLENASVSAASELQSLAAQLREAKDHSASLDSRLLSSAAEVAALNEKLARAEALSASLRSEAESGRVAAAAERTQLSDKLRASEERVSALSSELKAKTAEVDRLSGVASQVAELQRVNASLESTVQHLKNDKSSEVIAELEEEKAALQQKVDLLKQELANAAAAQTASHQAQTDAAAKLLELRQESSREKAQHEQEAAKLAQRIREIDAQTADKAAEYAAHVKALEAAIAEAKAGHDSIVRELHAEIDRLKAALAATQTDAADRRASEMSAYVQQVDQQKEDMRQIVDKLQRQANDLKDRLTVSDASNLRLVAANHELETRNDSASQKAVVAERDLADARAATTAARMETETLRKELHSAEERLREAEDKLRHSVGSLSSQMSSVAKDAESQLAEKNAVIESLRKQLSYSELATGALLEDQQAANFKLAELESHKGHAVDLQKQISHLNAVIADLKAKAHSEASGYSDTFAKVKAHQSELEHEVSALQSRAAALSQEAGQYKLEAQRLNRILEEEEQSFQAVRARCGSLEDEMSAQKMAALNATREVEEVRRELAHKDNDMRTLRDHFEAERLRAEERHRAVASMDPFRAQDHELRRMAENCQQLSRELSAKEQEVVDLHSRLRHKEGEIAGLNSTLEALRSDADTLRTENESMSNKGIADRKLITESKREIASLQAALQGERSELAALEAQLKKDRTKYQTVDQNSDLLLKAETRLHDLMVYMVDNLDLSDFTERTYSRQYAYSCLELVELVRSCVGKVVARLRDGERKVAELSRSNSMNLFDQSSLITPAKRSKTINGHTSLDQSALSGLMTPPHSSDLTLIRSSVKKSTASLSPAAKEAARLNAEVLREKRKFSALNEQHSDLLGLLAQQEVEMGVFRQALETRLTRRELENVDLAAQRSVIELYGSYTNFRTVDDERDTSINNQLRALNV